MRELTEEEIRLVNSSLESSGRKMKLEIGESGTSVKKIKTEKAKLARKRPIIFRPLFWGPVFIAIPALITLAIVSVISRVDSAMGSGALQALSKFSDGELEALGFDKAGLDWVPQIVQLYDHRTLILALTWGICLAISATFFIVHFRTSNSETKTRVVAAKVNLEDEMEELNRAYSPELTGYDENDTESDDNSDALNTREVNDD